MNAHKTSIALLLAMSLGALAAHVLAPKTDAVAHPSLQNSIPPKFGRWIEVPDPLAQVALTVEDTNEPKPDRQPLYDDVITRTYQRDDGARIMLAVAYSSQQRQERKIHRPELCYYAQGYRVRPLGTRNLQLAENKQFDVRELMTDSRSRLEPVTYWIRIGDGIPKNQLQTRWIIFRAGMRQTIPDGILVRASSLIDDEKDVESALGLQRSFLTDLYTSVSAPVKALLAGA